MENQDKKECENTCDKCKCFSQMKHMHGCCGGKYHLVKMILRLVIIIIIFWCGFKLGEISGSIRAEYGRGFMRNVDSYGLMQRYNGNSVYTNITPNTPSSMMNGTQVTPVP